MKSFVVKSSPEALLKDYPIQVAEADGWFFKCREESNCHFIASGEDLWGRKVASDSFDYKVALNECVEQAKALVNG